MVENLTDYFNEQHTFYLNEASYNRLELQDVNQNLTMKCVDLLSADITGNCFRITFKRSVQFTPDSLFKVLVELGADLTIKEGKKEEVQNLKSELLQGLIDDGSAVITNLASRASFIVSSLTSSFGQQPIVTPPTVMRDNK